MALPHLDAHSSILRSIVSLYNKDTQILLDLYGAMQVKENQPEYPGMKIHHVIQLLGTRAATDKEVKTILRLHHGKVEKAKIEEDKKLRDILLLPASETIIDSMRVYFPPPVYLFPSNKTQFLEYVCSYDSKTGYMILTSNYICFDPIVGGGPASEHQIALKFTELKEIKKVCGPSFCLWASPNDTFREGFS